MGLFFFKSSSRSYSFRNQKLSLLASNQTIHLSIQNFSQSSSIVLIKVRPAVSSYKNDVSLVTIYCHSSYIQDCKVKNYIPNITPK